VTDTERLQLCELIVRKIEGTLTNEEAALLNETLERHQEAVDLYVDLAVLYASLSKPGKVSLLETASEDHTGRQLDNLLLELSRAEDCAEPLPADPQAEPELIQRVQREKIVHNVSRTSLALLAVSAAAMLLLVLFVKFAPVPSKGLIGTLCRSIDARWLDPSGTLRDGCDLYSGPLHLAKGYAEIQTDQGATIILQAPVELELESPSQLVLKRGSVTVNIEHSQTHYVVRTPSASVVDFGTEFGVYVDSIGDTYAHVYQGEVELRSGDNPLQFTSSLKLTRGQGGQANAGGLRPWNAGAQAPFIRSEEFAIRCKAAKGSPYHRWKAWSLEVSRDPDLVAYYTFERDPQQPGVLVNMARATAGRLNGTIKSDSLIDTSAWNQGPWPEKTALTFDRARSSYVEVASDPDLGINGPITMAAWICVSDPKDGGHIAACRLDRSTINYQFGYRSPNSPYWTRRMHLARKVGTDTSSVRDWAFSEPVAEQFGWIHIAATHDNHTVRYYINGSLVDAKSWIYKQERVEAELLIGTTYHGYDESRFDGRMSELAIFKRVLSEDEIRDMYQAGKP